MTPKQKQWIDTASYETLLSKWRFAPSGDSMFQGDAGEYYSKVMFAKQAALSNADAVNASRCVGWGS